MRKENVRILQMFYFKQSRIEILIDIPCSWHDNTTDPLWGRRTGIPACKHFISNMPFSIGFWLIIDQSPAMPVRLGGGCPWWWMTNQQESCLFPQVSSYEFIYLSQRDNIVPMFSPNPQQITTLILYFLVYRATSPRYILMRCDLNFQPSLS